MASFNGHSGHNGVLCSFVMDHSGHNGVLCSFVMDAAVLLWPIISTITYLHHFVRCAREKRVTPKSSRNFTYRKCEGNIGEAVELCDKVEIVREFTYLGDSVSGGCEAVVTAGTRRGGLSLGSAVSCCMTGDFL